MRVYQSNEIKNISILGSSGSGKTTLAEAMLFEGGVIKRRGTVDAKNTVSDYFPVEKEYGYSVFSTVFSVEWQGRKLNFIDNEVKIIMPGGTLDITVDENYSVQMTGPVREIVSGIISNELLEDIKR